MPIRRSTIALTAFTAIAMVTSARGDATFEVSLFAVGIVPAGSHFVVFSRAV